MGALPEESEFPGSAELLFSPLEALGVPPVDVAAACALARQPRSDHARAPADRRRRRRLLRAAAVDPRAALLHGRREPRPGARARRYLQSHERPPLLNVAISLAVGADSAGEPRAPRRSAGAPLRDGLAAPPARAAARRCFWITCRERTAGRSATTRDASTIEQSGALMPIDPPGGSERGVLIGRTLRPADRGRSRFRRHRGLPRWAAAVDPAGRDAGVREDDRGRAARLSGRAPRLADRRRRPQARSQPRRAARARRPRARDRTLRRRSLPRPARPARGRAESLREEPRQLVPDRAAPVGARDVGDPGPQGRARRAGSPTPSCLDVLDLLSRPHASTLARPAKHFRLGRLRRRSPRVRRRRSRAPLRAATGDDDQGPRPLAAGAGNRARRLRPVRAAGRGDAEADRRVRDAARGRRPVGAQGRALRRGVVPARLARRPGASSTG